MKIVASVRAETVIITSSWALRVERADMMVVACHLWLIQDCWPNLFRDSSEAGVAVAGGLRVLLRFSWQIENSYGRSKIWMLARQTSRAQPCSTRNEERPLAGALQLPALRPFRDVKSNSGGGGTDTSENGAHRLQPAWKEPKKPENSRRLGEVVLRKAAAAKYHMGTRIPLDGRRQTTARWLREALKRGSARLQESRVAERKLDTLPKYRSIDRRASLGPETSTPVKGHSAFRRGKRDEREV